jgi:hypothetical protein
MLDLKENVRDWIPNLPYLSVGRMRARIVFLVLGACWNNSWSFLLIRKAWQGARPGFYLLVSIALGRMKGTV